MIWLAPPPEDAYTTANNGCRRETYAEAVALSERSLEVAQHYYGARVVPITGSSWIAKASKAVGAILGVMAGK